MEKGSDQLVFVFKFIVDFYRLCQENMKQTVL